MKSNFQNIVKFLNTYLYLFKLSYRPSFYDTIKILKIRSHDVFP